MKSVFVNLFLAISVGSLLAGCATMSPEECQLANWGDLGLRDGLEGKPMSTLDARIKDCAKAGVGADTGRYVNGRAQGLQTFCRLENAIPLGLNGGSYEGVCPPMIDGEFRRRFEMGRAVYRLRSEVSRLDARSDSLQRQLREAGRDEDKQIRETDKDEDRRRIRKEFDEHKNRVREELNDLDRRLRHKRDELRAAEFGLGAFR
jgi:hypothetical protein